MDENRRGPRRFRLDPCVAHVAAWMREGGEGLALNLDEARRFLGILDPDAGKFSFRTFSDTPYTRLPGRDPLERELHGSLDRWAEELTRLNRFGAAVCVTVNATNGQGRTPEDIVAVRALYLDLDGDSAVAFGPPPHLIVETSPGHRHLYWRVEGLASGDALPLLRSLCHRGGGDSRACALNQALRLPGFWHRKDPLRPFCARVLDVMDVSPLDVGAARRLAGALA